MEGIVLGRGARVSLSGEVTLEQKPEWASFILSEGNDYTFLLLLALSLFPSVSFVCPFFGSVSPVR